MALRSSGTDWALASTEIHKQLHGALVAWKPAGDPSIAAVSAAARQLSGLSGPAERIRRDGGHLADWWTIAQADPFHDWPHLRAFAENATDPLELCAEHVARRHGGDPGTAWEITDGRATWNERCLVVGHEGPGEQTRFIDRLNQGMVTLPYPWYAEATPEAHGRVALIADRFSFRNYFHWVLGGLRRLLALDLIGLLDEVDETIVLVNEHVPEFVRRSIEAVGLGARPIFVRVEPIDLRASSIVVVDSTQLLATLPPKKYGPLLRERTETEPPSSRRRRLLVSRRDATVRRVKNEKQLLEALKPYGFEFVVPGDLTFTEQAATFRQAEIVVGPHGAALTNLLLCAADTTIIEVQDLACSRPWFKNLSTAVGLRYHAVPCPPPRGAPDDFRVDVEEVLAIVRAEALTGQRRSRNRMVVLR